MNELKGCIPVACELTCRHRVSYWPAPVMGEVVYCRQCRDWRQVAMEEWWVRCQSCVFRRLYGVDADRAVEKYGEHVTRYPTHVVTLSLADRVLATYRPMKERERQSG